MSSAPETQNPKKWRYTWETLSHIPTLRLFLFNSDFKPSNHCKNLKVSLNLEQSLLLVSWDGAEAPHQTNGSSSLRVPVPRVLVDVGSPVVVKAMEDHIEVKLVLLLPVDHPLNLNIDSVLDKEFDQEGPGLDRLQPLSVDSDLKCLSSQNLVHLYCKSCSMKLTRRPLRSFVEMPSTDWREVADNWFGSCCCSFGGISEKLVRKYVNSYIFPQGTCLLDATSVIIGKDDLEAYAVPDCFSQSKENDHGFDVVGENNLREPLLDSSSNVMQSFYSRNQRENTSNSNELSSMCIEKEKFTGNFGGEFTEEKDYVDASCHISPTVSELSANVVPVYELRTKFQSHCCVDNDKTIEVPCHDYKGCSHDITVISSDDQESTESMKPRKDGELLNVSLGSGFMVRTSNLSKDVDWIEMQCYQCSSVLGAYPSTSDGNAPLDGGIRFFKCHISTALPVGGAGNIFRKYTLQRMFVNQLMDSANDELSFRTVVRDLRTRSPMLQIVLLNSDVWCHMGECLETEDALRLVSKIDLNPVVKVLFSDCSKVTEAQLRMLEEWITKNQADEVYMLRHQIKELINSLESATGRLPFSCSFMKGLTLSSIER